MFWDGLLLPSDPRWLETLRQMPRYDFHHLPGYVEIEAERRGIQGCAYVLQSDQGACLIPLLISSVPVTLQPTGASPCDALAPYGYAGPLIVAEGNERQQDEFTTLAITRLTEHLRCRNICSVMVRFHPLISVPFRPFQNLGRLVVHGETVCVDLRQSLEQMWSDTRHGFRNPINRMERQGYHFELDFAGKHLGEFMNIYHDTMLRVGAEPQYFFSEEYFRDFQRILGPGFVLAHARNPSGEIISSGIFTVCSDIVQYHLSGNILGGQGSDGSKLILHGIRKWAHENGLNKFHLGGGVGAKNDSLFNFKSGFSSGRAQYSTWRMVVDEAIYDRLCGQWERQNHAAADPIKGFFPAYRKMLPPPLVNLERRSA